MAASLTVNKADLAFILEQIKIAEAHAAGQPLFGPSGLVPAYNVSAGLRTVDGTYNHLLPGQETWGAAGQPFPTLTGLTFGPGENVPSNFLPPGSPAVPTSYVPSNNPGSMVFDSSLRTISNLLVDQTLGNPAAVLTALKRAGSANETGDLVAVASIYQTFKPTSDAEYQTRVVATKERAQANALSDGNPLTPPSAAEQIAINEALAAEAVHANAVAARDAARVVRDAALEPFGIVMEGDDVQILNIAPDGGLSASFNSWFTLFGQFFDHGLDLINKGGSGTVFIPLKPDDPLYVAGSHTNFMVLTRATVTAGPDGVMNTADDVRPINTTTAYVDQNQTYASHSSHQVFLRQYELNAAGQPVATGKLIEGGGGSPGGMATWGEVKAQALLLGIRLTDFDVGSVPLLRTDQYGNFIPAANGFAQVIIGVGADGIPNTADDTVVSGTPSAPVNPTTVGAIRTNSAFLADIAHDAVPVGKIADGDITVGLANPGNGSAEYDNELLDAHFIAGDGRANENIGLVAVHHVFHSEHNRMVDLSKEVILATGDLAFINEWLVTDVAVLPTTPGAIANLVWDGERLFQSAKFTTEMQYQHLVFEEFARKIQPQINFFVVPDGFDTTINPSIVAEFAHVVYRFGHSMLTESIDRFDPSFNQDHIGLIEGFLNPIAFDAGHTISDSVAAGAIIRGMTRQVGNEIDEFVTGALRNNLLGLPLDLATINLARGRDTGVPSLNVARAQFYEMTNNAAELKPYESWIDFAGNLKNEASIINFVAAYGTHSLITGQATLEGKRDAALTLITGDSFGGMAIQADAEDFLNGLGSYAGTLGGLNKVDLWIGGLAEKILPFGGMLGSTFNFVFERQMESLQDGDRFYYLQRLDGLHLFGELEANSFASVIMANTNATHLPSDVFSTPGLILEVDRTRQFNSNLAELPGADGQLLDNPATAVDERADNIGSDPVGGSILTPLVIRNNPATVGPDTNYLRYTGGEHVVLGGTDPGNAFNPSGRDILIASEGDDTLFGDGGNDRLEGGAGNDIINGGDGDDIITDLGGDDNIKGGAGNDVINAGPGLDLVLAGDGQDFAILGSDALGEVFGGQGNDFIHGNEATERLLGNEGDDWIELGAFSGAVGDNFDEIFAQDLIDGHDVFVGGGRFDEHIGEGGDDIFISSLGKNKYAGMSGWDWATYKDNPFGVDADLTRAIVFDENPTPPANGVLDAFEAVEGISGSKFNDVLTGSVMTAAERVSFALGGTEGFKGSMLNAAGIARIDGLQAVLGVGVTSYSAGDIILGGDGSDLIKGLDGDDIIDGDKWLDVQIGVFAAADIAHTGTALELHNRMSTLVDRMVSGEINPGQLSIVRTIRTDTTPGDIDTAVYRGALANYAFGLTTDGMLTVTDVGLNPIDGTDKLRNIERLQFADNSFRLVAGTAGDDTLNGTAGNDLLLGLGGNDTLNGLAGNDMLVGGTGTDLLNGGLGADTMVGLAGNDTYVVDNAGDVVVEALAAGTDTIETGLVAYSLELVANVENLMYTGLGAGAFTGTGNSLNNVISGGDLADTLNGLAGNDTLNGGLGADILNGGDNNDTLNGGDDNDTLNGGLGNDTLNGGLGNDAMNGGAGDDTFIVDSTADTVIEAAGGGIDTVQSTATFTLTDADVEHLTLLGVANIDGTGNASANVITGNAGNNVLNGGTGIDTVSYATAIAGVTVSLSASGVQVTGGAGTDTLTGFENVVGSAFVDTLTASGTAAVAVANLLQGGDGNDTLVATVDNARDTLNGGDGSDTANYAAYLAALTVNLASAAPVIVGGSGSSAANSDVLVAVENFVGGSGADTITGNASANVLDGGLGNDIFNYSIGGGADTIIGGGDADTLNILGVANNDVLDVIYSGGALISAFEGGTVTGVETITVNLGGGANTLSYTGSATAVTVNLATNTAAGFTSIASVLNVTGGSGADSLNGNATANMVNGDAGDDIINGGTGGDTLIGGAGADAIDTGSVNDNVRDFVRFTAAGDYGDTVTNFDATGLVGQQDLVQFSDALNALFDDGNNNDNFLFASGNGGLASVNANVGQGNADVEALLLTGAGGEGVTTTDLGNAALVALAFSNEFVINAANGEDALLVVNDTNGNSFSVWQWVQAGGGEISAAEITLIGTFTANGTATVDNFDFV